MIGEPPNDLELLATRSSHGDAQAFDELVRQTHRLAYQLALRTLGNPADVDDVLQDAYLRVWQGLGRLRDHGVVLAWICRIVRNVAADRVRKFKRERSHADLVGDMESLLERHASPEPDARAQLADAERNKALATAVAGLKEKHRVVLLLREVDDMSYEQISTALGIALGTVESRLFRARRELAAGLRRLEQRRKSEVAA